VCAHVCRCSCRLVGARCLPLRIPGGFPAFYRSDAGVGLRQYSQQKWAPVFHRYTQCRFLPHSLLPCRWMFCNHVRHRLLVAVHRYCLMLCINCNTMKQILSKIIRDFCCCCKSRPVQIHIFSSMQQMFLQNVVAITVNFCELCVTNMRDILRATVVPFLHR